MLYMCVFIQIYDIQVNHMITNSTAFIGNIHSCGISQENKGVTVTIRIGRVPIF